MGRKLRNDTPSGLTEVGGMILFGNGACVVGSITLISVQGSPKLMLQLWEKSPLRSRAVGMVDLAIEPERNCRVNSWDAKKNGFFLSLLKSAGINRGPPPPQPATLSR